MALTNYSLPPEGTNHWREAGRFDGSQSQRTNQWSDAAALGDQVEQWLGGLSQSRRDAKRERSFLGTAEAQLPGTGKNNWREPLDLREGTDRA